MFRHKGKSRTLKHNIGIAALLSFVAGTVNVVGFLSVQKLTTNVTGHFAFMVEEAVRTNWAQAVFYAMYILSFFTGAFFSSFVVETVHRLTDKHIFIIPVLSEAFILLFAAFLDYDFILANPNFIACTLLFAMGLQNALVTSISNSIVRTTHLTGLFTDLGIELAQLFFYRTGPQKTKLLSSIRLRFTIIIAFFTGGVAAGAAYMNYQIRILAVAALILLTGIVIDYFKVGVRLARIERGRHQKL
ncbi:YoaK family protein [Ravibacter arvi]|uniref:YoaK family protein n=1 Tax=Ravibacter arvi TaxID=2051041 RepID=A0ABP8M4I2_9BACT